MVNFIEKYEIYLKNIGLKISPLLWFVFSFLLAIIVALLTFVILPDFPLLSFAFFILIFDIFISFPYLMEINRINEIEESLPDVLKIISDTLRAGGTIEYALREISSYDIGPMKKEINNVVRKLEEGDPLDRAFSSISENVDSRLVKRTITIIIDAVRAGAALSELLEDIAEDARAMHRVSKERKSRTLLQTIFIVVAGSIVAPAIFGFATSISTVLINSVTIIATPEKALEAFNTLKTIFLGVEFYIIFETVMSAVMIAIMRDGNIRKSLIYFPILCFLATACYIGAKIVSMSLLGGIGVV
ncbi:MAG: type II secretion system F family protein [Candidatus Diapherotrites archaeon]|nr:type II secretion system F family protein [Candidatus Diapherotrites archaeon]